MRHGFTLTKEGCESARIAAGIAQILMNCPACKTENPEGAKYCLECGTRLVLTCTSCGTELPLNAKFCFDCGANISEMPGSPGTGDEGDRLASALQRLVPAEYAARLREAGGALTAERRLVTILLSDVKGSTAMGQELDPEEVMEIIYECEKL